MGPSGGQEVHQRALCYFCGPREIRDRSSSQIWMGHKLALAFVDDIQGRAADLILAPRDGPRGPRAALRRFCVRGFRSEAVFFALPRT